jgi:uncharacterized membrane protein YjgN (DUF898 family)
MSEVRQTPAAAVLAAHPVVPQFLGRRGALFTLVFKTMMLTLLTLGVYRFWAKTRLRRYFWGNVVIAGEPLEYTGKATELLIGFLIVIAVLVPLSVASTVLGVLAEGGPLWVGLALNVAYAFGLVFLIDFATYRMWRYRLTRTRWRGIRFGMENGAFRYAGRAFLWRLGQILSLGFITPWMRLDLAKFRVARMRLGDRTFALNGPARPLVLGWLGVWGAPVAIFLVIVTAGVATMFAVEFPPLLAKPGVSKDDFYRLGEIVGKGAGMAGFGVALLGGLVAFAFYRVFEARYFINCTRVGEVRLESELKARSILPAVLLAWVIVVILFTVIMAVVVPAIGLAVKAGGATREMAPVIVPVVGIAVAGLMLVLSPLVTYPIAVFQTVRHVWTTLSIHDIVALDGVLQAPKEEPRFGEGLADALDVGAI